MAGRKAVGVIAGTQIDTEMGIKEFENAGLLAYGEAITDDPGATTNLQVLEKEKLFKIITKKIKKLKRKYKIDAVCIYCNSLSTAVNLENLKKTINLPIITPLESYKEVAKKYSVIGVIAANCQAAAGIEKIIQAVNSQAIVVGIGILPLVNAIEKGESPAQIIQKYGLKKALLFLEKLEIEIFILGCTHFPYFADELEAYAKFEVFNPADFMVRKVKEHISDNT